MFSQASTDPLLSNKKDYTTLVRIGPPFSKMGCAVVELFHHFNWKRAVMISRRPVGTRFVFCDYASRSIEEQFEENNITLADWIKIHDRVGDAEVEDILQRIKQRGRSEYFYWVN